MYYLMYCGISSNLLLYCNAAILINRPIRVAVLTHVRPFLPPITGKKKLIHLPTSFQNK